MDEWKMVEREKGVREGGQGRQKGRNSEGKREQGKITTGRKRMESEQERNNRF